MNIIHCHIALAIITASQKPGGTSKFSILRSSLGSLVSTYVIGRYVHKSRVATLLVSCCGTRTKCRLAPKWRPGNTRCITCYSIAESSVMKYRCHFAQNTWVSTWARFGDLGGGWLEHPHHVTAQQKPSLHAVLRARFVLFPGRVEESKERMEKLFNLELLHFEPGIPKSKIGCDSILTIVKGNLM